MRLSCTKCHHNWDETVGGSAFMVQCPECFTAMPLSVAKMAAGDSAPVKGPGGVQAPPQPAEVTKSAGTGINFDDLVPGGGGDVASGSRPSDAGLNSAATEFEPRQFGGHGGMPQAQASAPKPWAPSPRQEPEDGDSLFSTPAEVFGDDTRQRGAAADAYSQTATSAFDKTAPVIERDAGSTPGGRTKTMMFDPNEDSLDEIKEAARGAASADTKAFNMASPKEVDLTGKSIAGYQVTKMLGAGGMGAVCLARQVSLDREVALKILPGRFAHNPEFLVRFTREALSAAQMTHHNIIQVYDVGSDADVHYISMELVKGDNLGNMVRKDGTMRPEDACGFILQAARGLKYAHERGIVHRDIKPDNLMVNDLGILKIADMGLAKMSGKKEAKGPSLNEHEQMLNKATGDLTMQDIAMGTPAYMPPEQARDASGVDHRADQYSLGCTLYYLVAGQAPYSGSSAYEIISKHMDAPPPMIEDVVKNVPGALSGIIRKMMAKEPAARYPGMAEVIRDLETVLGVESEKGPYTPREQHLKLLEEQQARYYAVPGAKLRALSKPAFFGGAAALMLLSALAGSPLAAGGFLGLMALTPLAVFVTDGVMNKTHLFRRVRSVFFGMGVKGWAVTAGVALAVAGMLHVLGLLVSWLVFSLLAVGLAVGYQMLVARTLERQRAEPLTAIRDMLKQLRLKGVGEDQIMDFVGRFAGEQWEEMFESLFGYEAMIAQREKSASVDRVKPRKKFATWREPVAQWLDGVEESRKERRERAALAKVETARLKSEGKTGKEAEKQANAAAAQMLDDIQVAATVIDPALAGTVAAGMAVPRAKKAARVRQPGEQTLFDYGFRAARLAVGGFMSLYAGAYYIESFAKHFKLPGADALKDLIEEMRKVGLPDTIKGALDSYEPLGVGLMLLFSAASGRRTTGFMATAGTAMVVFAKPIQGLLAGAGVSDPKHMAYAGLGLAAAGLTVAFLGKSRTGRF